MIAVYANWGFARIKGIGWGWAGVIWLYSIVFYFPLDIMKFAIRYILSGKAWLNLLENKVYLSYIRLLQKISLCIQLFGLLNCCRNRLRSPPRKIMGRKREKLNGPMLKGHYMGFNHQKLQISSMTRATIESCLRLLNRPRDEQRLQGTHSIILPLNFYQTSS